MSSRLRAALLAACILLFAQGQSLAADLARLAVTITTADQSDASREIVGALQRRLPNAEVQTAAQIQAQPKKERDAVHIAVGPVALRALLGADLDGPIVSVFTSSFAYRQILAEQPVPKRGVVTAIYADPAPADQLQLIRAIYKRPVGVGVLVDPSSSVVPAIRAAASEAKLDVVLESLAPGESIFRALNRVANQSVLLAVPDPQIYNAETLRNVLIASYRREQAVVGFSAAFVKAGALAATVSDADDVSAQLEATLAAFASSGRLPAEQFPIYFSVLVNDSVARSLNLVIDDEVRRLQRKPRGVKP